MRTGQSLKIRFSWTWISLFLPKTEKINRTFHGYTKRMLRKKRRLYKRARKSKTDEGYTEFKKFCITARNKLHSDYHKYLNNLIDPEQDSTSKFFWKYIKARKQDSVSIGTLKADGIIAESIESTANLLNKQFVSVFTKEDLSNISDKGQSPFKPMDEIVVNENGVKNALTVWMRIKPVDLTKFQLKF